MSNENQGKDQRKSTLSKIKNPTKKQAAATIHFSIYLLDLTIISISYDSIAHWDILVNIRALGESQEVAFQQ